MPYVPFDTANYAPSTTPPTVFTTAAYDPSETPPTPFGTTLVALADIAALKAVATTDLEAGAVRNVKSIAEGEVLQAWTLRAGVHADDVVNGFAQPADYDADNNAKYWERTL